MRELIRRRDTLLDVRVLEPTAQIEPEGEIPRRPHDVGSRFPAILGSVKITRSLKTRRNGVLMRAAR